MKWLKVLLKLGVSAVLLAWFFSRADIAQIRAAAEAVPSWLWPVCFLMLVTGQLLSSVRWYWIVRALGFDGAWARYFNYYFSGMFFNLFLPTGIGGDVLKVFFLARGDNRNRKLLATYSVLLDRFFGFSSLMFIGAGAVIFSPGILPAPFPALLLAGAGGALGFIFFSPVLKRIIRPEPGSMLGRIMDAVLVFWRHPEVLAVGISLSLVLQTICIVICLVLGRAMHVEIPDAFYCAAFPLIGLLTLLPVSFNGIGLREGGFVYFMGIYGVPPGKALMVSLGFFSLQVAVCLLGGIIYSTGGYKKFQS